MQLHGGEPCWGRNDGGRSYFENVLMGTSCDNNWYEGFMGWQEWNGDAPAVLGFDSSIDGYCRGLQGRRRRLARGNATTGNAADGDDATTMSNRRRRLNAAWLCHEVNRNILMLFGTNVHGTGAGYNSCRNLEWQICAALGRLPGQRSPRIVFSTAPSELDTAGARPLGKCGGYKPRGCGWQSYANDDIFFLEVCIYAKICRNRDKLFRLRRGEFFICDVDEEGFRDLQHLLADGPHPKR